MALLIVACGPTDESETATERVTLRSAPVRRPQGWSERSHGERARADYARLFRDDVVQRIDIEIAPDLHTKMLEDLHERIGPVGSGSRSPLAVAACTEKLEYEPCEILGIEGICTQSGQTLACEGLDQVGPLDMIPGDPISIPVTVRYEGRVWTHVSMRFKGNSSLSNPWRSGRRKLPLRMNFDGFEREHPEIRNQRFFGFDEMTFAPAYSDASLIREKIASDLLLASGVRAARAAFYRIFVDSGDGPTYWGLYTMLEDPSDQLPSAQFEDGTGNVYKPDGPGADFTRFDRKGFEKKTNEEEEDYEDVLRALEALHAPRDDAESWRRSLEAAFDVETFLHNLALTRAIDHWDGYGQMAHNYYLYGDPSQGGKLVWISWDHNLTFNGGRGRSSLFLQGTSRRWPLVHFLLSDPVYRARYVALLQHVVTGVFEKSRFDAHASRLHAQIAPYVVGPEGEAEPYTLLRSPESFASALPALIAAADARRATIVQAVQRELAPPEPPPEEPDGETPPAPAEPTGDSDARPLLAVERDGHPLP